MKNRITIWGFTVAVIVFAAADAFAQTSVQTAPTEDIWLTEKAFERAIIAKQDDAARRMFHADFVGVDADGSTYTADAYFVRRAAESLFFDVEDESHPGGGVIIGTLLIGSSVQRFSHVWLQTPQGWRQPEHTECPQRWPRAVHLGLRSTGRADQGVEGRRVERLAAGGTSRQLRIRARSRRLAEVDPQPGAPICVHEGHQQAIRGESQMAIRPQGTRR